MVLPVVVVVCYTYRSTKNSCEDTLFKKMGGIYILAHGLLHPPLVQVLALEARAKA